MSDDRLAELRRQRALAAEKQAQLEREIAAAEAAAAKAEGAAANAGEFEGSPSHAPRSVPGGPATDSTANAQPHPFPAKPAPAPILAGGATGKIEAEALQILDSHRQTPKAVKSDVFRGCLFYLLLAFVITGVGSVALYFVFQLF